MWGSLVGRLSSCRPGTQTWSCPCWSTWRTPFLCWACDKPQSFPMCLLLSFFPSFDQRDRAGVAARASRTRTEGSSEGSCKCWDTAARAATSIVGSVVAGSWTTGIVGKRRSRSVLGFVPRFSFQPAVARCSMGRLRLLPATFFVEEMWLCFVPMTSFPFIPRMRRTRLNCAVGQLKQTRRGKGRSLHEYGRTVDNMVELVCSYTSVPSHAPLVAFASTDDGWSI